MSYVLKIEMKGASDQTKVYWFGKNNKLTDQRRKAMVCEDQHQAEAFREEILKAFHKAGKADTAVVLVEIQTRPSYSVAISFIAMNDESKCLVKEEMVGMPTVHLTATLWGMDPEEVAEDVIAYRVKHLS